VDQDWAQRGRGVSKNGRGNVQPRARRNQCWQIRSRFQCWQLESELVFTVPLPLSLRLVLDADEELFSTMARGNRKLRFLLLRDLPPLREPASLHQDRGAAGEGWGWGEVKSVTRSRAGPCNQALVTASTALYGCSSASPAMIFLYPFLEAGVTGRR